MKIKRYVGIDPSSTTGFFIQDEDGTIIEEMDLFYEYKVDPQRMIHIADTIVSKLNPHTDIICIEGFSYNSKGRGIEFQFGNGWVIRETLFRHGFEYFDVTPAWLKKFATGNGAAKKENMVTPIKIRWGYYHASDNITDAFVLSEIAKAINKGSKYEGLRPHERDIVRQVKSSVLNQEKWEKTKIPSWMNPRSKYYWQREEQ